MYDRNNPGFLRGTDFNDYSNTFFELDKYGKRRKNLAIVGLILIALVLGLSCIEQKYDLQPPEITEYRVDGDVINIKWIDNSKGEDGYNVLVIHDETVAETIYLAGNTESLEHEITRTPAIYRIAAYYDDKVGPHTDLVFGKMLSRTLRWLRAADSISYTNLDTTVMTFNGWCSLYNIIASNEYTGHIDTMTVNIWPDVPDTISYDLLVDFNACIEIYAEDNSGNWSTEPSPLVCADTTWNYGPSALYNIAIGYHAGYMSGRDEYEDSSRP